jgi:hypothetical protein
VLAFLLGFSVPARAQEGDGTPPAPPQPDRHQNDGARKPGTDRADVLEGAEGETPGGENEEEKNEERFSAGLDLVLGWGRVPFAVENPPQSGSGQPTYTRSDQVPSDVQSLLLGASLEVAEHVGVGVRIPFTFASFSPDGSSSRGAQSSGNVELEGEYARGVLRGLKLFGSLGVALPTAAGTEIPDELSGASPVTVNAPSYDRYSLSQAASAARGSEDSALFDPHRLGIVPKLGAVYRIRSFTFEPYVKIENLFATTSLSSGYVGELVGALRVGYKVRREFEFALKGWVNVGFAGSPDERQTAVALEPQLVLRFGPIRPYAGVVVPLAGPPHDEGFFGVRLGAGAAF